MPRDYSRPFAAAELELLYPGRLAQGAKGSGVRRAQEWLRHHLPAALRPKVDGSFGGGTEAAVQEFQRTALLEPTGVVDVATWDALVAPLRRVMTPIPVQGRSFREMVVAYARQLLAEHPRESGPEDNDGVWVRILMRGNDADGGIWEWCAGTVCFLLAQAAQATGTRLLDVVTPSDGVPELARDAQRRGRFLARAKAAGRVEPGDVFLVPKGKSWSHTGVVVSVEADGTFWSVEGNTSDKQSPAGYAVFTHRRPVGKVDYLQTGPL